MSELDFPPQNGPMDASWWAPLEGDPRRALDHLDLWELPWMKPDLSEHQQGLSWDDRWMLGPDEIDDEAEEVPGHGHLHLV